MLVISENADVRWKENKTNAGHELEAQNEDL